MRADSTVRHPRGSAGTSRPRCAESQARPSIRRLGPGAVAVVERKRPARPTMAVTPGLNEAPDGAGVVTATIVEERGNRG